MVTVEKGIVTGDITQSLSTWTVFDLFFINFLLSISLYVIHMKIVR